MGDERPQPRERAGVLLALGGLAAFVLGLAGRKRSGKTTLAKALEDAKFKPSEIDEVVLVDAQTGEVVKVWQNVGRGMAGAVQRQPPPGTPKRLRGTY